MKNFHTLLAFFEDPRTALLQIDLRANADDLRPEQQQIHLILFRELNVRQPIDEFLNENDPFPHVVTHFQFTRRVQVQREVQFQVLQMV